MAKTTIDGLKVRESSPKRRPAPTNQRQSAHIVDMTTSRNHQNPSTHRHQQNQQYSQRQRRQQQQRRQMLDSIDAVRQQKHNHDFLDPVETFDFDAEEELNLDAELSSGVETDWSDLLDDLNNLTPNHQRALPAGNTHRSTGNDFLDAWSDEDQNDFLSSTNLNTDEFDDTEETEEPPRKAKKARRKKHHFGRIFAVTFLCLLVIGGGIFYKWGDELISRLTGGNSGLWDALRSIVSDEIPFEADANGRTNVLIFGTEGYNMSGDTAFGEHSGSQLTDSIMVVSFNQETKDVALLSLPRDLKVPKACSAGKINEVFWCHNKEGDNEAAGAQALMDQVGDILGLQFQYYAHINWASLIDIINTIGGITVTLDEDINDYGWTNAVAKAGVPMEVDGEQALGLARARHGTTGGDFTRGNTQQKIVEGIINKVLENGIGITEALGLLDILGDNLRSNFSTDNVKAGVHLATGFNISNIRQIPLVDYATNTFYMTTATINDISYVVPSAGNNNYSEIKKYVAEMLSNNPAAREDARIVVYNASGQYGVASAERERLQNDDYDVVSVGDAELGSCAEKYCVYAVGQDFPHTYAALAERYGVQILTAADLPADITPGETDFIIIIGLSGDAV